MTWDLAFTHDRCLDDFTGQLAEGAAIRAVLRAVEQRQVREVRDPEVLRFLVGSDDEIETAERVGLRFHPLPPAPAEVAGYGEEQVRGLREHSLRPLAQVAAAYHGFADRVEALLPRQSQAQAPWVREIRDGLRAYALRAQHAVAIYEGALAVRAAAQEEKREGGMDRKELAAALSRARAVTERARVVVRRRESDYRYPPALTIAGDERGTPGALVNRTIYPYRYLSRTHRLFYWTRPDEQLAELVRAARGPVAGQAGEEVQGAGARFERGSLRVHSPAPARRLEGLLPGLQARLGDDGAPFLELALLERGSTVTPPIAWRGERTGSRAGPTDLPLALGKVGDLVVRDARIEIETSPGASPVAHLAIQGRLKIDDVVDLMVKAGGFERSGARVVLAVTLGFLPGRLPDSFPIALRADGTRL